MPDKETLTTFVLFIPLLVLILGGIGFLIKWWLSKPQTQSTVIKTEAEAHGITQTANKTTLETKKLELDIEKLISTGNVESVGGFAQQVQTLLLFAQQQSEAVIRQSEEHQLIVVGLRTQLQAATSTVGEQAELIKKQTTIIEYQGEQYDKIYSNWSETIIELNDLKDKLRVELKGKETAIAERDEARRQYIDTKGELDKVKTQVECLIKTMRDHDIHVSNA